MLEGFSETEIANELGLTPSYVSERLSELKTELLFQNGAFPPLTEGELSSLKDSIDTHGIQVPVFVGRHIPLIDGRHRLLISQELGIPCPAIFVQDLDAEEERELSFSLNAARRQMNRLQRQKLVDAELMRDPARSDRRIAAICGVSPTTAGAARAKIAEQLQAFEVARRLDHVSSLDTSKTGEGHEAAAAAEPRAPTPPSPAVSPPVRVDTLGRQQPASKPPRPYEPPVSRIVHEDDCPWCQGELSIVKTGDTYTLQAKT